MKIGVLSFTEEGYRLAERIKKEFAGEDEVLAAVKCSGIKETVKEPLDVWVKEQFQRQDALVFVGAAGIAVRVIAPYVCAKTTDPAVIVLDEAGNYCIPVLSGHIGGANELALRISERLHCVPVLTTATDVRGKWAVDVFAVKNNFQLENIKKAKDITAKILAGNRIRLAVEPEAQGIFGQIPEEISIIEDAGAADVKIGIRRIQTEHTLCLIPKVVSLGIGCRKGTKEEQIEEAVRRTIEQADIFPESIVHAATVDLKAEEEGLIRYCKNHQLKLITYCGQELQEMKGDFTGSEFVRKVTGTDNVCERSAVKAGGGKLIMQKQAYQGVTTALAVQKWRVCFE